MNILGSNVSFFLFLGRGYRVSNVFWGSFSTVDSLFPSQSGLHCFIDIFLVLIFDSLLVCEDFVFPAAIIFYEGMSNFQDFMSDGNEGDFGRFFFNEMLIHSFEYIIRFGSCYRHCRHVQGVSYCCSSAVDVSFASHFSAVPVDRRKSY
jgi:hypothetical protein